MSDFHWRGSGSVFAPDSKDAFERLFGKDADEQYAGLHTSLLGESHIRYVWDLFFYLYSGGAEGLGHLERKHGASDHISRLNQFNYYFVTDLADMLLRQDCPAVGSTEVYVLQFGSWDLTYSTLRATLQYKENVPHFLAAIRLLVQKCGGMGAHESSGKGRIHLVWVSPSPETRCLARRGQQACEDKRHANNNHAISAITQKVHAAVLAAVAAQLTPAGSQQQEQGQGQEDENEEEEEGTSAHYSTLQDLHVTYEFIDAKWIAQPRLRLLEGVCMSHLLCHPSGNTMLLTAAGLAVAGEILASLSRTAHKHAFHYHNALRHTYTNSHDHSPVPAVERAGLESIWRGNYSTYADMLLVTEGSAQDTRQFFYRSSNGLRRLVPDKETLACLLRRSPQLPTEAVTAEGMADVPLVAAPLPSRRPGLVYTSDNMRGDGQFWVVTPECTRKRLAGAAASSATVVFEMDIYDIPED